MNELYALREIVIARFSTDLTSVHGLSHWTRVERIGLHLAKTTGADALVIRLFALLHDSCRRDEEDDPDHGTRAALSVQLLFEGGMLPKTTSEQRELLVEAIGLHADGGTSRDPTIGTCWDADRLDLARLQITPDPKYLSTDAAKGDDIIERSMRLDW